MTRLDAVLFDIGGTLVAEEPPATDVSELQVRMLPTAFETVRSCVARYRVGAVTNTTVMREPDVRDLLTRCCLNSLLEVVVTSVDVGAAKPDPRGLLEAANRLGVDPGRTLYVGDRDVDRDAAIAAGMHYQMVGGDDPYNASLREALVSWMTDNAGAFEAAAAGIELLDEAAMAEAAQHQLSLTKPPGSLGRLESAAIQLAGISATNPAPVPRRAEVAIFAGDHGVVDAEVTPWPQEVTTQMVATFLAGGAAINVLARHAGAGVTVVDVGVASELAPAVGLLNRKIRKATRNLAVENAMTVDEARQALDVGSDVAMQMIDDGADCLITGDMGIANTTPSAALIAALCGLPSETVTGRGTGIDDAMLSHKQQVIRDAVARIPNSASTVEILAAVGGYEIAAIAGYIVGAASRRRPVLVDGVIACAGLVVAAKLAPGVESYCFGGHRSAEPGASAVLAHLSLEPLLDLDLRLGEGTGACLAFPLLQAAALLANEMATFDSAGIRKKD